VAVSVGPPSPLVVTLEIDPSAQQRFDRERAELFPPGRTQVGAHVTLFHAVPGAARRDDAGFGDAGFGDAGFGDVPPGVLEDLRIAADRAPFPVRVEGVMPLGRGVAYRLVSNELSALHRGLQAQWWDTLTAQDRQGLRAHVTVQNKVQPDVARSTMRELQARFEPFTAQARGLLLWRYDGGPWTALRRFAFREVTGLAPTPTPGR
jgi:2'-5' RNA ligase